MSAYYNEVDPFCVAWLRELIARGLIADGDVDERPIEDVRPADLRGYRQCHFFAGIGGWSAALRLAGWPDGDHCWTGSCPCQPFSSAGQGRGTADARHLWPQFRRLIRQCRPAVVFGEQVASQAGRRWLSAVFADLEALAYRAAGADLCGPSVGAFDIRQRLWFVADTTRQRHERQRVQLQRGQPRVHQPEVVRGGEVGFVEHADIGRAGRNDRAILGAQGTGEGERRELRRGDHGPDVSSPVGELADGAGPRRQRTGRASDTNGRSASELGRLRHAGDASRERIPWGDPRCGCWDRDAFHRTVGMLPGEVCANAGRVGHADTARLETSRPESDGTNRREAGRASEPTGAAGRFWSDVEWIPCTDGKWRPTQPGLFPLAHGVRGRMVIRRTRLEADTEIHEEHWYSRAGALRGFGNAIKPQVAAAFIAAYRDVTTKGLHV